MSAWNWCLTTSGRRSSRTRSTRAAPTTTRHTSTSSMVMLDELEEHVEYIDMANNLHSIVGLNPLLGYLKNSHAGIRAKAAEVVSIVVQNNSKSQQLFMESNGLEPLLTNSRSDPNTTTCTKALGAISSLIHNNQSGLAAFHLGNVYAALKDALGSDDARHQSSEESGQNRLILKKMEPGRPRGSITPAGLLL